MEAASLYDAKVTELLAIREEREQLAAAEKEKQETVAAAEVPQESDTTEITNEAQGTEPVETTEIPQTTEVTTGTEGASSIETLCVQFAIDNGSKYESMGMKEKMKKYFDIPDTETIYLSHDDTMMSSGKDGFVITDKGLYCNKSFENELYFVPYSEFTEVPTLSWDSGYLYANDKLISYVTTDDEGKKAIEELYKAIFEIAIH